MFRSATHRAPQRAPLDVISLILAARTLLRILLGPLQVASGVVEWSDPWLEVAGFPVWGMALAVGFWLGLGLGGFGAAALGAAVVVAAVAHLCGYRRADDLIA